MPAENQVRPHVLVFPAPLQGHVPPILKLAELLFSSDPNLYVTFLNTEHVHQRITRASHALNHYSSIPNFRFLTIPDGLPADHNRSFVGFLDIMDSLRKNSEDEYKRILLGEVGDWPRVTCVLADGLSRLAYEVAAENDVPTMIVRTSSACSVLAYYCAQALINNKEIPFQDESDQDEAIQSVPGMQSFLRGRDLPSLIRRCKSTEDRAIQYVLTTSEYLNHAKALILNTVDTVEELALLHLNFICPCIYKIGPLHALAKSNTLASYWKEDMSCLQWLDKQRPKSVVYVSFGSITVMSEHDVIEFWHGLVGSGYPFLWVIRPDSVDGGVIVNFRQNMKEELGCIVEWAPQKEVLGHESVGCFLTHSGWNSTLESIVAGVPMVCWPYLGDQMINSRFVEEVWKIGVDMKDLGGRGVVEKMVREVMEGRRSGEMRGRVEQMKRLAADSVKEGGTSREDLKRLIMHIKSLSFR